MYTIDIRELRRAGILEAGDCSQYGIGHPDIRIVADLSLEREPVLVVEGKELSQRIPLRSKPARLGGRRWFLVDEDGRSCDVLYYSANKNRFISRKAFGLRYISQELKPLGRLVARKEKIRAKLESVRGPGAPRRKKRMEQELAFYSLAVDAVGLGIERRAIAQEHKVADRQAFSRERLKGVRTLLSSRKTMSPTQVRVRYLDEFLKLTSRLKPPPELGDLGREPGKPDKQQNIARTLDILILKKLGYVVEGKLTSFEIGWPDHIVGLSDRRLFAVFDLRKAARRCVIVFIKDGGNRPVAHFFWIGEVRAAFDRKELRFYDPVTDEVARQLIYKENAFVLGTKANLPAVVHDPEAERVEAIRRQLARVLRQPKTAPNEYLREFEHELQREKKALSRSKQGLDLPDAGTRGQSRILKTYGSILKQQKSRLEQSKALGPHYKARSPSNLIATLNIWKLRQNGYLNLGALVAGQLDWPDHWIGNKGRRLFLLSDMRDADRLCVLFVIQDEGRKPKTQLFRIWSNGEGDNIIQIFQDPLSGEVSFHLHYRRGKFRFPGRPWKPVSSGADQ